MDANELRRGMKFSDPSSNVSVRDRDTWRWKDTEVTITNVRKYGEDPEDILIYYKDNGGNKWKADAAWFLGKYGEFLKTAQKKSIMMQLLNDINDSLSSLDLNSLKSETMIAVGNPPHGTMDVLPEVAEDNGWILYDGDFGSWIGKISKTGIVMYINEIKNKTAQQVEDPELSYFNDASIPRSCPNCGTMAMGKKVIGADGKEDIEFECKACGAYFSLNNLPNSEMLRMNKKSQVKTKGREQSIIKGMAKTLSTLAWADFAEEHDATSGFSGQDLMEISPEPSQFAIKRAEELYDSIEEMNGVDLNGFVPPGEDDSFDLEKFGFYLVMEALGHGVAWTDDHEDHGLEMPLIESYWLDWPDEEIDAWAEELEVDEIKLEPEACEESAKEEKQEKPKFIKEKQASYSHSFSPEFYGDPYDAKKVDVPTNLADALASMDDVDWDAMVEDVFPDIADPSMVDVEMVWEKAIETDTVGGLESPVDVWIDPEGYHVVHVFDEGTESQEEGFKKFHEGQKTTKTFPEIKNVMVKEDPVTGEYEIFPMEVSDDVFEDTMDALRGTTFEYSDDACDFAREIFPNAVIGVYP